MVAMGVTVNLQSGGSFVASDMNTRTEPVMTRASSSMMARQLQQYMMLRQAPESSPWKHWMQKHSKRMKRTTQIIPIVIPLAGTIRGYGDEIHWIGPAAVCMYVARLHKLRDISLRQDTYQ